MPSFIKIVQAVKKLNSISRERLNFRRRPFLCTTLYRNLMQASNFGGTFDQLSFEIFYEIFTEDASPFFLYHGAKKSKMTKNSNQGGSRLDPLSAKPSFQLWYPGGQRWKVISFSWSGVKSPSKCFSNTEPTTIIASRDEKRCNAPVQRTRLVHSSSLRLSDQYRKCHGRLLFFAFPALQPDRPAAVHLRPRKQRSAKR